LPDQDQEMSFAVPSSDFERLMAGLEYIGKKGAYRYPVPNLSALSEPKIPENYFRSIRVDLPSLILAGKNELADLLQNHKLKKAALRGFRSGSACSLPVLCG